MKYEFKKIATDEYQLVYTNFKNETITKNAKLTIDIAKEIQGSVMKARLKMYKELTDLGMTKEDLIVKKNDGKGNITYDETNYQEFENKYIEEERGITINEIFKKMFGIGIEEFIIEMYGSEENVANAKDFDNQMMIFGQKFALILKGGEETPSESCNKSEEL